jgi:hypothetical protein
VKHLLLAAVALSGCDGICDGPACAAGGDYCPASPEQRLFLEYRRSLATDEDDNPEIVRFIPGSDGRAIVNYTDANRISEFAVTEDSLTLVRDVFVATGNLDSDLSAIENSPDGRMAAIAVGDYGDGECDGDDDCIDGHCVANYRGELRCQCLPGAPPGCGCGNVIFVDTRSGTGFGTVLGRVGVGWAPDSTAFTPDGRYLITADEDDADIACKPNGDPIEEPVRHGGSVSIIELAPAPPALCETPAVALGDLGLFACRVQQIPVTHDLASEPEEAAATLDLGIIAIQETDELGFIDLTALPAAELEIVSLSTEVTSREVLGPDGLDVSPDGRWLAIGLEDADSLVIMDIATRTVLDVHDIHPDVPPQYNRDVNANGLREHEPEQVAWVASQDGLFVLLTLQESSALIAYRIDADGSIHFDSIQPLGIRFRDEFGGTEPSRIRPEGLSVQARPDGGTLILTAQEREGSLTALRAACPIR